jgi:hypothetical protein
MPDTSPADPPTVIPARGTPKPRKSTSWQQQAFRTLNRFVEPAVRAGMGNSIVGPGLFVVESIGRRTRKCRPVPVLGVRLGDTIVTSTVRPSSQWVRNLDRNSDATVWVAGHPRKAKGTISTIPVATVATLKLEYPSCSIDQP